MSRQCWLLSGLRRCSSIGYRFEAASKHHIGKGSSGLAGTVLTWEARLGESGAIVGAGEKLDTIVWGRLRLAALQLAVISHGLQVGR